MTPSPITTRADTCPDAGHNDGHVKAFNFIREIVRQDPSMPFGAILVLLYLYEHRDCKQGVRLRSLRKNLEMTATVATRSIYYWDDLMISIQIDPKDRRSRLVKLTAAGEDFVRRLEGIIA